MENSHKIVSELVKDFKENEKVFLSPSYQESQVRLDFIDKFFAALGWDVTHTQQKNPYQQEVKIENKVVMESSQRRADYAFAIAPNFDQIKFFVEAKKPARNLANPDDYFQTIRYAWNSKTHISVLTDFEEFHILDCRYKPNPKDALDRRIASFHYSDYINEETFAKIYHLFSREAVLSGSLDLFISTLQKKMKTASALQAVDDAFLEELDEYRVTLAKAFKKTNEQLQGEELTEAVQRTIDRLVFIRFLEDKGIEDKQIITLAKQKDSWGRFVTLCKRLDPKYNGLVFKPHRILDSGEFNAPEDKAFAGICQSISDPSSPYDFNQIPVSILGSIYERFLGKVVHATDKRVKIEDKPDVKKAGGVFYTPEYIVRYIVKETVGKLIEGKTPAEISKMAFADIACGSGSFLIEVYDLLLDYHRSYYNEHPESVKNGDVIDRNGILHLSLKKKKEILVNNIYGVDIDFQATEVTQISLYLKLLEEATVLETYQLGMFKESILPSLYNNIVCGNSLIGTDINGLFDSSSVSELKPMNYDEMFPEIMKRGGFDCIVGNPPYRMIQPHNTSRETIDYLKGIYVAADFKVDLFHLFIQKAVTLLKMNGLQGYIVPSTLLNNVYVENLRLWIMNKCKIVSIAVAKEKVFANADVHTCVIVLQREVNPSLRELNTIKTSTALDKSFEKYPIYESSVTQQNFNETPGKVWNVLINLDNISLLHKLREMPELKDVASINRGLITGDKGKYFSSTKINNDYVPIIGGGDVNRYYVKPSSEFVLFKRPSTSGGCWDKEVHFAPHKIVIRQIGTRPTASIVEYPLAVTGNIFTIMAKDIEDELFILGIINSSIAAFFWKTMFNDFKNTFPQVTIFSLSQLPIHPMILEDKNRSGIFFQITEMVRQILVLTQKQYSSVTESDTIRFAHQCKVLDRKIDEAVYTLYGLTEEEIRIVEG